VESLSASFIAIVDAMVKIIAVTYVKKMKHVNFTSKLCVDDANYSEVATRDGRNKFLTLEQLGVRNYYQDPWMTEVQIVTSNVLLFETTYCFFFCLFFPSFLLLFLNFSLLSGLF